MRQPPMLCTASGGSVTTERAAAIGQTRPGLEPAGGSPPGCSSHAGIAVLLRQLQCPVLTMTVDHKVVKLKMASREFLFKLY